MKIVTEQQVKASIGMLLALIVIGLVGCASHDQSVPAVAGGGTPPQIQENAAKQHLDTSGYAAGGQPQPEQPASHP